MLELAMPSAPAWTALAACRDVDPEMFFGDERVMTTGAKKVCKACPVRLKCLTLALNIEGGISGQSRFGIFGGLTPDERADIGRRRSA